MAIDPVTAMLDIAAARTAAKSCRHHIQLARFLAAGRRFRVPHRGEGLLHRHQHVALGTTLEHLGDERAAALEKSDGLTQIAFVLHADFQRFAPEPAFFFAALRQRENDRQRDLVFAEIVADFSIDLPADAPGSLPLTIEGRFELPAGGGVTILFGLSLVVGFFVSWWSLKSKLLVGLVLASGGAAASGPASILDLKTSLGCQPSGYNKDSAYYTKSLTPGGPCGDEDFVRNQQRDYTIDGGIGGSLLAK